MVQDINNLLANARKGAFVAASLFSLAVIILSALVTSITSSLVYGGYFAFAALGIATGLLTLLTLPAMLFMSTNRKGAISSMIIVEAAWTWFLWILWLATASSAASITWIGGCGSSIDHFNDFTNMCRETQAVTAFSFLAWFILFAYNLTLIFCTVMHQRRGHSGVWTGYVGETDYTAPPPVPNTYAPQDAKAEQYPPTNIGYNATPVPTASIPQQQAPLTSPYPQV